MEQECSAKLSIIRGWFLYKKFDLDKELCGKRVRLFFEGVEQAMYVWLNGEFIGYAEDSFTPSEFDLTPYMKGKIMCLQLRFTRCAVQHS